MRGWIERLPGFESILDQRLISVAAQQVAAKAGDGTRTRCPGNTVVRAHHEHQLHLALQGIDQR